MQVVVDILDEGEMPKYVAVHGIITGDLETGRTVVPTIKNEEVVAPLFDLSANAFFNLGNLIDQKREGSFDEAIVIIKGGNKIGLIFS